MPTAEETINAIIANALLTAQTYTTQVADAANDLIGVNAGFYIDPPSTTTGFALSELTTPLTDIAFVPTVTPAPSTATGFAPAAVEPTIPSVADATITYDAQLAKLIAMLSAQLAGFFASYYPLASDAFDEATTWLVNTITNGGTGINQAIWDQVWQRGRENVIADGRRVQAQIVTGFAAKGIMLPAGAMIKKISESLFDQAGKVGQMATANAMKQVEIEVETIKFAIGKALESRQMAMQAAADYIRAIATAPDAAVRVASINTDTQAKMMGAAAEFYRARLNRDDLVLQSKIATLTAGTDIYRSQMAKDDLSLKAKIAEVSSGVDVYRATLTRDELDLKAKTSDITAGIDVYKHRRENATENDRVEVQALTAAADAFARTASAALASLNSIVSSSVNSFA